MGEWLKRKNLQPNPSSKRQLFNVFKGIIKIQLTFQWIKLHFVLFTMTVLYKHTCMQVLQTRVKRNLWGTIIIETVHWHHCLIAYPFFVFLYTFLIISGGMPYLLATYKDNKFWKCSYSALTTITQKIKMQIRG